MYIAETHYREIRLTYILNKRDRGLMGKQIWWRNRNIMYDHKNTNISQPNRKLPSAELMTWFQLFSSSLSRGDWADGSTDIDSACTYY